MWPEKIPESNAFLTETRLPLALSLMCQMVIVAITKKKITEQVGHCDLRSVRERSGGGELGEIQLYSGRLPRTLFALCTARTEHDGARHAGW